MDQVGTRLFYQLHLFLQRLCFLARHVTCNAEKRKHLDTSTTAVQIAQTRSGCAGHLFSHLPGEEQEGPTWPPRKGPTNTSPRSPLSGVPLADFTASGSPDYTQRADELPYRSAGETPSSVERAAAAAAAASAGGGALLSGASILQLFPATSWRHTAQSACQGKECFGSEGEVPALLGLPKGRWPGQEIPPLYLHREAPFSFSLPFTGSCRHFVKLQGRHFVSVHIP